MSIYNPYRNYERGMDDAYMGKEPQSPGSQYMEGYLRCEELFEEEDRRTEEQKLENSSKEKQFPEGKEEERGKTE